MALMDEITTPPSAPSRSDPTNFRTRADAFIDWLANTFPDEINAIISTLNNAITDLWYGTSVTSMTIGTGSKSFTVAESLLFFGVGSEVRICETADPTTNYMDGTVTAYNGATGAMTVLVASVGGSGTISAWTITPQVTAAALLNETDMASNSAVKGVTQYSLVQYVLNAAISLANKTLTSPVINSPTINSGAALGATSTEIDAACDGSTAKNSHVHQLADGANDVTASAAEVNKACDGAGVSIPIRKKVDIGDWNMDGTSTITVAHGLTYDKIIGISSVYVRNDADSARYPLQSIDGVNMDGYIIGYDSTHVTIARVTGQFFDSTDFDSTSYNRGWIVFEYID